AAHPELGPARLTIPRGQYRLVLENTHVPIVEEPAAAEPSPAPVARNPWKIATLATAAALILVLIAAGVSWQPTPASQVAAIRQSPAWSKLLSDTRPITVVLGDYYIFAEKGELSQPQRLVREFFINSREDLDQYLMDHPEMDKYMDVQLSYLPTSSAHVMAS